VILNLAKNPAGFNQNIESMLEDREPKRLIIVINDNEQDGTDVSWLWDVDFDGILDDSVKAVSVSGIRALDMSLRLKYVGIPAGLAETPENAIENQLQKGQEKLYVLVNYTALFSIHRYLQRREKDRKETERK
jgi:UDP-N-acetylmuramyl tripeptide synthase